MCERPATGVPTVYFPADFRVFTGEIVSASHDRKFFDTFMLIVGVLVALTLGLIILARIVAKDPVSATREADADYQKEVQKRIEPVARVAVAGADNSALTVPAWRRGLRPGLRCVSWRRRSGRSEVRRRHRVGRPRRTGCRNAAQARTGRLPGQEWLHAAERRADRPFRSVDHQRGRLHGVQFKVIATRDVA
jgi:hypothetical protein